MIRTILILLGVAKPFVFVLFTCRVDSVGDPVAVDPEAIQEAITAREAFGQRVEIETAVHTKDFVLVRRDARWADGKRSGVDGGSMQVDVTCIDSEPSGIGRPPGLAHR